MAVTKRTRFEVLRRDNHTCRYCGATAPDATLTVDHVTPTALGGGDDPSNLVAACRDCNAGKSSTKPDESTVEDVKQTDLKWAGAIKRVAAARGRQLKKADQYAGAFFDRWHQWSNTDGEVCELPQNWKHSLFRFYELGVDVDEICSLVDLTMGKPIRRGEEFRYFAGCVWRVVTEMQDAAKALLDAEEA